MQDSRVFGSFMAGAIGAVLATALVLTWAVNNPNQVARFLGSANRQAGIISPAGNGGTFLAEPGESRIVEVVRAASPAVVSIVVTQDVAVVERFFDDFSADPFGRFFGPFQFRVPRLRENGTQRQEIGGGSGFLVAADGLIVTNRHVVAEPNADYTVFTNEGEEYSAQVIARDPVNDIAILKIEATNLPFLQFASSTEAQPGQTVIAIGNALGEFRNTVSVGVISGLARSIQAGSGRGATEQLENVIQTDAAINPGNSGGPLLNSAGQVIGVNVAVALGSENIGFALPSDVVRSAVESVQKTGKISRAFLGVRYTMITPPLQAQQDLPTDYGALIITSEDPATPAIVPGSPAAQAGLVPGDIILEVDGVRLDENRSLAAVMREKQPGQVVTLVIWHDGNRQEKRVTLQEFAE